MEIKDYLRRAFNGHVLIVTFVMGLFATVMIGLQQSLANAESQVKNSLAVLVFLQTTVPDAEASQMAQRIKTQDPDILSIMYISKDQAYQDALKDPGLAKSLLLLKNNPLPASLVIRYSDSAWWERSDPAESLKSAANIQEIRWDPQARALFRTLHRWRLWCLRFSVFVLALLGVWAFIGLYRFLSLHSGLPEIAMQLMVGSIIGGFAAAIWSMGLRFSLQADFSSAHPAWGWALPVVIGAVAALGCYGIEFRHAE